MGPLRKGDHVTVVVDHPRLGPFGASALRAQFESNLTAIWFKFDVGRQETSTVTIVVTDIHASPLVRYGRQMPTACASAAAAAEEMLRRRRM